MRYASIILAFVASVAAHGAIISAVGNADPSSIGAAFGIVPTTPRDGSQRNPFQTDSSIIRDRELNDNGACGRTIAGGPNDVAKGMKDAAASGAVAKVRANGGEVVFTLHQVNGDGAGPYNCEYSANGKDFQKMSISVNVPGENSRSRTTATDFPLVAQLPPNVAPGMGMVRCRNVAPAGPFGGCAAVMVV